MAIKYLMSDDIFISYSRMDASTYAPGLADKLIEKDFSPFIDTFGTDPNPELPETLRQKIRSCSMFVVLATKQSAISRAVEDEIIEFLKTGRPSRIIPVDVDGSLFKARWYPLIEGIAPQREENPKALKDGNPSPSVISRIEKSFTYTKSKDKLRRASVAAASLLVTFLLAAFGAGAYAYYQVNEAAMQREITKQATAEATQQKQNAEKAKEEAEKEAGKAAKAVTEAGRQTQIANAAMANARAKTVEAARQKEIAEVKSKEALAQQQQASAEKHRAERETQIAFALHLNQQAAKYYEDDPILGLRLGLEALAHGPADDDQSQKTITDSLRLMSREARIGKLGGEVEKVLSVPNTAFAVIVRRKGPSELRLVAGGQLIAQLPEKVAEENFPLPHCGDNPGISSFKGLPFFQIHYESGLSEVRELASGALIFSGEIACVGGDFQTTDPYFIVWYKTAAGLSSELRRADSPKIVIALKEGKAYTYFKPYCPVFAVLYKNEREEKTELRRVDDGKLLETYHKGIHHRGLDLSWDHSLYALSLHQDNYIDYSLEIRRSNNHTRILLPPKANFIEFSPSSTHFIVGYEGAPGEIRRTDNNSALKLSGVVTGADFIPQSGSVVIRYANDVAQVLKLSDGHLIKQFDGGGAITVTRPLNGQYFSIKSLAGGHEIRSSINPSSVLITGGSGLKYSSSKKCLHFSLSMDHGEKLFSDETGQQVALGDDVAHVRFVNGLPFAVIDYHSKHSKFLNLCTGDSEELRSNRSTNLFDINLEADRFFIPGEFPELRQASTGHLVMPLSREENSYIFSPTHDRFLVRKSYLSLPSELRRFDTGAVIGEPFKGGGDMEFNSNGTCFSVTYYGPNFRRDRFDLAVDVRRSDTGVAIVTNARAVDFSPDGSLFLVRLGDQRTELWSTKGEPHRLTELKTSCEGVVFDSKGERLVVWFADGSAYLIDATWLESTRGTAEASSLAKMVDAVCRLLSHRKVDDEAIRTLLAGAPSLACRAQ